MEGFSMAVIHGILSVRLKDYMGVISTHDIFVQVGDDTTLAEVVSAAGTYFLLLDPLTDAMGVIAHFTMLFASTGMKSAVTVENRLDDIGLFAFTQPGAPYKFSEVIPAFAEGKQANGGVNLADEDVQDWLTYIEATGVDLQVESKARIKLGAFLSCQLADRKHRKAVTRVSYRTPS
jgi:hypothetical protein